MRRPLGVIVTMVGVVLVLVRVVERLVAVGVRMALTDGAIKVVRLGERAGDLKLRAVSALREATRATMLAGALPAAALALLVQGSFDLLDRFLIPRGLRLGS